MAKQKQDDWLEPTYSSYVKTQDVTMKTCRRRWIIGISGERGSGNIRDGGTTWWWWGWWWWWWYNCIKEKKKVLPKHQKRKISFHTGKQTTKKTDQPHKWPNGLCTHTHTRTHTHTHTHTHIYMYVRLCVKLNPFSLNLKKKFLLSPWFSIYF